MGVRTDSDELKAFPTIPDSWDYFRLENLEYRGKVYSITYDKTGEKYGMGTGLFIKEA